MKRIIVFTDDISNEFVEKLTRFNPIINSFTSKDEFENIDRIFIVSHYVTSSLIKTINILTKKYINIPIIIIITNYSNNYTFEYDLNYEYHNIINYKNSNKIIQKLKNRNNLYNKIKKYLSIIY